MLMAHIEAWSDLTYQNIWDSKTMSRFSRLRDAVILEDSKVNFHDKRSLLVMLFFTFTDVGKNMLLASKTQNSRLTCSMTPSFHK